MLRKHVRFGKDAVIQIERGQFICGVSSCSVTVRFDDGPGRKFSASEPADRSSTLLFIKPFDMFYTGMSRAKRVHIEADFYQQGNQTADFDISGFDPKQF
ncbi:hypothetical protein BHUM_02690 [Candidatus Burkholderia humilis]|nr:hypothetical protein BHUM_02690 [Candidatus Burkholderia humilis]